MSITTQLIGKTSALKGGLFRIKERLLLFGMTVRHPLADHVVRADNNRTYVYNPEQWTEYEILLDLSESIRDTDLHIVSNDIAGIIGREAALSIVYAMSEGKPVIITHKPYFRPNVDQRWIDIITRNLKELNIHNLLKLNNSDLKPYVELVATQHPQYHLTKEERTLIKRELRTILRKALH